jgi:dolichol-phosphate mannosyltransferase
MLRDISISVVLPAFNEADNIEMATYNALRVLQTVASEYEVIIVNDGSTDATGAIADGLVADSHLTVRAFHHDPNRGYGAALATGFRNSRHSYIFYTDADNQFDIGELKHFVPLMQHCDFVTGFRIQRSDSRARCFLSWAYNRAVNLLFRVGVRDVDCSFKLFRREVLERISLESSDFFADTELIAKARREGFRIMERGVHHFPRLSGQTTVRPVHILRTLYELARFWKRMHFSARTTAQLADDRSTLTPLG